MENLILIPDSYKKAPVISFKRSGEFTITGRSIAENIHEYFRPALDWINGIMDSPPTIITLTIKLEYFNTKSSQIILYILKMLEQLSVQDKSNVLVNWFYEEDDSNMYESGIDYHNIVNIPFNYCVLNEV